MTAENRIVRLDSQTGKIGSFTPAESLVFESALRSFQRDWKESASEIMGSGATRTDGQPLSEYEVNVAAGRKAYQKGLKGFHGQIHQRISQDPELVQLVNPAVRADAYTPGNGFALPLQMSYIVQQPLDQPLVQLTAEKAFVQRPVPAWAQEYILQRNSYTGRAAVVNGSSSDIPIANSSRKAESHKIITIAMSYEVNLITESQLNYGAISKATSDRMAARRAIRELINEFAFFGNPADLDFPGLLNYPELAHLTSTTAFTASGSASTMLDLLNSWAAFAMANTNGVGSPDTMLISTTVWSIIATKNFSNYQTDGATVLQVFLKTQSILNPGLKVMAAPELNPSSLLVSVGAPSGYAGIVFLKSDVDSASIVLPLDIQELPPQLVMFDAKHTMFARFGGFASQNAYNNLVVWVPLS